MFVFVVGSGKRGWSLGVGVELCDAVGYRYVGEGREGCGLGWEVELVGGAVPGYGCEGLLVGTAGKGIDYVVEKVGWYGAVGEVEVGLARQEASDF